MSCYGLCDRREKLNEVLAQLGLNFYMSIRKAASEVCSAGGTGTGTGTKHTLSKFV